MPHTPKSAMSSHTPGCKEGNELKIKKGPEPGREGNKRTARDSTSINSKSRDPIDPRMPHMPPP